jgi:hypothetical protein
LSFCCSSNQYLFTFSDMEASTARAEKNAARGSVALFSMVKRGLATFCDSKQWTKQAAARGAEDRRFVAGERPAHAYKTGVQNRFYTGFLCRFFHI